MIYLASSWRNKYYPGTLKVLRDAGHDVYDFRHGAETSEGRNQDSPAFAWEDIDPEWQGWNPEKYIELLRHPLAQRGFKSDDDNLRDATTCVLLLPCGRSAHLEMGIAIGMRKTSVIYIPEPIEPELMYLEADAIVTSLNALLTVLPK